jgi:hypothetical protein
MVSSAGEGRIAQGYFSEYWSKMNASCAAGGTQRCRTAYLANMSK